MRPDGRRRRTPTPERRSRRRSSEDRYRDRDRGRDRRDARDYDRRDDRDRRGGGGRDRRDEYDERDRQRGRRNGDRDRERTETPPPPPPAAPVATAAFNWMQNMSDDDSDSVSEETAARRAADARRARLEALSAKLDAASKAAPVPSPQTGTAAAKPPPPPPAAVAQPPSQPPSRPSTPPPGGGDFDVFAEDSAPIDVQKDDHIRLMRETAELEGREDLLNPLLTDNFLDNEGYYAFKPGEVLHRRYIVDGKYGSGVFSIVLKARMAATAATTGDATAASGVASSNGGDDDGIMDHVAIKVIRANDHMTKTGRKEMEIMKQLAESDPKNRKHCLRYVDNFFHANHLCVVLEPMDCNLRDVLKKYGRTGGKTLGLSMAAVRSYTKQLCLALSHLEANELIHADFKPDNILVSRNHSVIKLADFGSALYVREVELTPYLVSRFYRAPEVMLGLPYAYPVDMWALGCTAFELFTGRMMFPGRDNNAMLCLQQEVRGAIPKKLARNAAFQEKHFNEDLVFIHLHGKNLRERERHFPKPTRPVEAQLDEVVQDLSYTADQKQQLSHMRDFIEKATMIDPSKRLTAGQSLHHPFVVTVQTRRW